MKTLFDHIKKYVLRGLLAVIPLVLTVFVLHLLYVLIDRRVTGWVQDIVHLNIPGLGIVLVLILLYVAGVIGSNFLGRQIFGLLERLTNRIPLVGTTYQVGKQLASTFSLPEKQVFKRAVLLDYLKTGTWTIGFVTGTLRDQRQPEETLLKVYVPTPPNPTSGFIVILPESQTRDPGWSIEEAMKMVVSAGIIGPEDIR